MAYGDFKDLTKKTTSDKILRDKAFNIAAKNPKCYQYQYYIIDTWTCSNDLSSF